MKLKDKAFYFGSSLYKNITRRNSACPSCGCQNTEITSRKYIVTSLLRCKSCALLFRAPTTSAKACESYYQNSYSSGFTTDVPSSDELASYLFNDFKNTPKDFSRYIEILGVLGCRSGDRLLDFGCSWGYGVRQFAISGFDAFGYDVSASRVAFARANLHVLATVEVTELVGPFDIFFSAHVLEHVPSVRSVLAFARGILRPGGLFISVTPNGSIQYQRKNPSRWKKSWGLVHPNLLDETFYAKAFEGMPFLLTSELGNSNLLSSWSQIGGVRFGRLDGWELLAVYRNSPL